MKKQTGYVTSDKKFFTDIQAAAEHELVIKITQHIEDEESSVLIPVSNDVAEFIRAHANYFRHLLFEYFTALEPETSQNDLS